jgi:hypothetical protein
MPFGGTLNEKTVNGSGKMTDGHGVSVRRGLQAEGEKGKQ